MLQRQFFMRNKRCPIFYDQIWYICIL